MMAGRIAQSIARWDSQGEVARRLDVRVIDDHTAEVVATFGNQSDEQDATAYADGYADGYADAEEAEDDEADEEEDETDEEADEEEDEADEEEEDEGDMMRLALPRTRGR